MNTKLIGIVLAIGIIIAGGAVVYIVYGNRTSDQTLSQTNSVSNLNTSSANANKPASQNVNTNKPVITNSNTNAAVQDDSAKGTFDKMKLAVVNKDIPGYQRWFTDTSKNFVNQDGMSNFQLPQSLNYVSQKTEGSNIIITANFTSPGGSSGQTEMVFVRENDEWRFDLIASINRSN